MAESGGVISGSDELRLERTDDKVLDVAVGLRRRIQLHFRGRACTINQLKRPVKIKWHLTSFLVKHYVILNVIFVGVLEMRKNDCFSPFNSYSAHNMTFKMT